MDMNRERRFVAELGNNTVRGNTLPADRPTRAAPVIAFDQESRTGPGICLRAAQLTAWNFDNNRIDVCSSGGALGESVNYLTPVHAGRQRLAVARDRTRLPESIRTQVNELLDGDGYKS